MQGSKLGTEGSCLVGKFSLKACYSWTRVRRAYSGYFWWDCSESSILGGGIQIRQRVGFRQKTWLLALYGCVLKYVKKFKTKVEISSWLFTIYGGFSLSE